VNTLNLKPTTAAKLASFKTLDALLRTSEGRLRVRFGLSGAEITELKKALRKHNLEMSKRPYTVRNPKGRHPVEKKQVQLWVYLPEEIVAKIGLKPQRFIKELVLAHFKDEI
jgi:hypothetical protein